MVASKISCKNFGDAIFVVTQRCYAFSFMILLRKLFREFNIFKSLEKLLCGKIFHKKIEKIKHFFSDELDFSL